VNYYVMSDLSSQLLLDKADNEQPLERLLKSIYGITNVLRLCSLYQILEDS